MFATIIIITIAMNHDHYEKDLTRSFASSLRIIVPPVAPTTPENALAAKLQPPRNVPYKPKVPRTFPTFYPPCLVCFPSRIYRSSYQVQYSIFKRV